MNYLSELRREIFAKKENMSDEDLFASASFFDYLRHLFELLMKDTGRSGEFVCIADANSDYTASTDGYRISANTFSPLVRAQKTRLRKYLSIIGHLVHEAGHLMFTDFYHLNKFRNQELNQNFDWFGKAPKDSTKAETIRNYLNDHLLFRKYYQTLLSNLVNIEEDIYEENCLYSVYGGLFTMGLTVSNEAKYELSQTLEEMLDAVADGKAFMSDAALCILQIRALGFRPKTDGNAMSDPKYSRMMNKISGVLKECQPYVELLAHEGDSKNRIHAYNEIMSHLFDLIPEIPEEKNEQNGSGEGQSEKSAQNVQTAHELKSRLEKMLTENGASREARGNTKPIAGAKADQAKSAEGKMQAQRLAQSESGERSLNSMTEEVATNEAENTVETKHVQQLQKEAFEIQMQNHSQEDWQYNVERPRQITPEMKCAYARDYQSVAGISKSAVRKLNSVLRERNVEGWFSGYEYGTRFNYADMCHHDGKYFSRETAPLGDPKLAVAVLVDMSGSMSDEDKITQAKKTAIVLEDILRSVRVPFMVCGHYYCSRTVSLQVLVDFDQIDQKDRYRIEGMDCCARNNDGASITYCCERLLKRQEEKKLLIVVSDGLPTASGFRDFSDHRKDAQLTVEHYRKQGVQIFGAVIDGNIEYIRNIYGDRTMDVTETGALPYVLTRLVKRYVVN